MTVGRSPSRDSVRDQRIERLEPLVSPNALLEELPLSDAHADVLLRGRAEVHAILDRDDDRLLVVVGPCSVHDVDATLEYAAAAGIGGRAAAGGSVRGDAGLLREAAHDDRLEGADQ